MKSSFFYAHSEFEVRQLPVLRDNYIYLIINPRRGEALVIDPALSQEVIDLCAQLRVTPVAILNTHHHWDHTDGNLALKEKFGLEVVANGELGEMANETQSVPGQTKPALAELELAGLTIRTLRVPGHTQDHLAYLIGDALFCGDLLFGAGCGRIFEGTAKQMWQSLQRVAELPLATKVYCAHEYTLANLQFARRVDGENPALAARSITDKKQRRQGRPTIPTTIGIERATNPFLRPLDTAFCQCYAASHGIDAEALAVFTDLRASKDHG
ncbi:MAG: hydroxyacylglutathione hydrolase [Mariprofundales bacterium]|nr:hydroxyacylglutathione hydrolase [Mariprofundales bacterium]